MKTEVEKSSFLRVSINQRSPSLFPPGGPFTLLSPPSSPLSGVYASESDFCPAKRDGNVDEQRVTRPSLVANLGSNLTDRLTTRTIKRTSASAAMSLINEPALIVLLDYSLSKGERRLSDCLYLRFQFASITSPFFLLGSKVIGKKRN